MARHFPAPHQTRNDADGAEHGNGDLRVSEQLTELGITRIVSESFSVGPYRYTNLADAIAQAKRDRAHTPAASG